MLPSQTLYLLECSLSQVLGRLVLPHPACPPRTVMLPFLLVCIPTKTQSKAKPAQPPAPRYQQSTKKTEAAIEIPPEAVQEYMDIMDWLERLSNSDTGELEEREEKDSTESQQERQDLHPDPGFLRYMNDLCSQENFVEQVNWNLEPGCWTDCERAFWGLGTRSVLLPAAAAAACVCVCVCV